MSWRDEAQGKFVNFKSGPFTGVFVRGEKTSNKWGECVRLYFTKNGHELTYETRSKRLLGIMANIPDGTEVRILRNGEGTDTFYEVEVLGKSDAAKVVKETAEQVSTDNIEW